MNEQELIWKAFDRQARVFENRYFNTIFKALNRAADPIIQNLPFDPNFYDRAPLTDTLRNLYRNVGVDVGLQTIRRMEKKQDYTNPLVQEMDRYFQEDFARILSALHSHSIDLIIAQGTDVLEQAAASGWGAEKTGRELRKVFTTFNRSRARRIARTETLRASTIGDVRGVNLLAQDTGSTVESEWIPTFDQTARDFHMSMSGQTVTGVPDGMFTSGNGTQLRYPRDERAPASETVNCFLPGEISYTDLQCVRRVFRSRYVGNVITVKLANGRNFTCTPNHPILTPNGWMKGAELNKGVQLIKSSSIEPSSVNFKVDNRVSTFEQIYDLASIFGDTQRVAASNVNFHGHKPTGDVDIINVNRVLGAGVKFSKPLHYFGLKLTNLTLGSVFCLGLFNARSMMKRFGHISHRLVGRLSEFFADTIGRVFKPLNVGLRTAPYCHVALIEDLPNGRSCDPISFRQGQFRFTGNIPGNDLAFFAPKFPTLHSIKPGILDNTLNNPPITANNVTDFLHADPGLIEVDDVVSVDVSHYDGFVYTLETDTQMYDINGYVARNCRCTLGHVLR